MNCEHDLSAWHLTLPQPVDGGLVHANGFSETGFQNALASEEFVERHRPNMHVAHMQVKHIYAPLDVQTGNARRHNTRMADGARRRTYLREWRKVKPGRTLEMVAEQLHISQPQLGRIERGDQPYNQDLLEALADLYGCGVADLLMRDPSDPEGIWSIWDQAKKGQRQQLVEVAKVIVRTGTEG